MVPNLVERDAVAAGQILPGFVKPFLKAVVLFGFSFLPGHRPLSYFGGSPVRRFVCLMIVTCLWLSHPGVTTGTDTIKVLVAYHSRTGHTEKMAQGVVEGAKGVAGTNVMLKRVGEVLADDLFSADALVVGTPVYWSNMAGEVKTFFDNWQFKFGVFPEFKMRDKVGAAFATGGQVSSGKETSMLTILAAMLGNQMIVVSGGGAFGASATTEGDSPGIDEKELASARMLGRRVAEVTRMVKSGKK
jgi:NAD(P)H dehydrogenase (quinone)